MANKGQSILNYISDSETGGKWGKALKDIFYFVEHYVPRRIFDLRLASQQQKNLLQSVQDGRQYFLIRAPRKGGKTILVAIVAVWLTLREQTFRFFIVSGSEAQAKWLYDYCKDILYPSGPEGAATRAFFSQFLLGEPKQTITEYKAGGWIRYSAASSKQVNAPTSDALAMDEFVLIPETIVEEAWPMNRSSKRPMRFLLSTATAGKENTDAFLDFLDDAEPEQPLYKLGWRKFEWRAEDSPHLQTLGARADSDSARYFLSDDMYETQYKGGLPKRAGRIFPRTFIRSAFVAPDPNKPGFLLDGTPFELDPLKREFRGAAMGGIDWGFDHDTVFAEGYRGLDRKIHVMKLIIGSGTSPSDWAQVAEDDSLLYSIQHWYADASGAFQNQEIKDRGFPVTRRAFQHLSRGKEWMIGIAYYWLAQGSIVIPDTPEFTPLKNQLLRWQRDSYGKPKKGNDHCCDAFICLLSAWDPRYYEEGREMQQPEIREIVTPGANDWESFKSTAQGWLPDNWKDREELRKEPWEK